MSPLRHHYVTKPFACPRFRPFVLFLTLVRYYLTQSLLSVLFMVVLDALVLMQVVSILVYWERIDPRWHWLPMVVFQLANLAVANLLLVGHMARATKRGRQTQGVAWTVEGYMEAPSTLHSTQGEAGVGLVGGWKMGNEALPTSGHARDRVHPPSPPSGPHCLIYLHRSQTTLPKFGVPNHAWPAGGHPVQPGGPAGGSSPRPVRGTH
jgi:hypothetical protein